MATYTYTGYTCETRTDDQGKTVTKMKPTQITVPLAQMDTETDAQYMSRIYGTALWWLNRVTETDIPAEGPVRVAWDQHQRAIALTQAELADERHYLADDSALYQTDGAGMCARMWMQMLERRTGGRN